MTLAQGYRSTEIAARTVRRLPNRLKLDRVSDETTRAIDRIFDFVDKGVDVADRVLNRHQHTEDLLRQKRRPRRAVIDAEASSHATSSVCRSPVAKKPHFYIVEAADPKSGDTIYVVTDGGSARTECATRDFAAQILRALEKAS